MQVHLLVVDPLAIDEVLVLARRVVLVVNLVVSSDIFSSTIFSSNFGSRVQLFTLRLRTATCESPPPPSGTQPPVLSSLIITWVTAITTTIATTSLSLPPSIDHRHHNAITATKNMSTNIGPTMDRDTMATITTISAITLTWARTLTKWLPLQEENQISFVKKKFKSCKLDLGLLFQTKVLNFLFSDVMTFSNDI